MFRFEVKKWLDDDWKVESFRIYWKAYALPFKIRAPLYLSIGTSGSIMGQKSVLLFWNQERGGLRIIFGSAQSGFDCSLVSQLWYLSWQW